MRCLLLLALFAAACSDEPAVAPEPADSCSPLARPVVVEMGTTDPDQANFSAFGAVGLLPITAGFQGLVFVSFALRSDETLPPRMEASMRLSDDTGRLLLPATKTALFFEPQADGSSVDPNLLLLLDPPIAAAWSGVTANLEVEVYGGSRCARISQRVQLTDRGGCFMDASGAILCNPEAP
jgi:hypothetical protein